MRVRSSADGNASNSHIFKQDIKTILLRRWLEFSSTYPASLFLVSKNRMASKEEALAAFASEKLVSSHSFNFIEGWIGSDHQLHTRKGEVAFDDLPDFLNGSKITEKPQEPGNSHRFRVLSFPRLENGRLKIAFPRETYQQIKRSWRLHDFTLEAFLNNNGILCSFNTKETKSILMKVTASRSVGFDTVSIVHHRPQNVTYVLYHSLEDEAGIFNSLLAHPERCLQPAFFAAVLYRCHQQRVERFRNKLDDEIVAIERGTKLGGPGRLFGHRYKHEEPTVKVDCDSTTQKLSYVQTELAVGSHTARSSLKCGEWLVKLAEDDHAEWKKAAGTLEAGKTELEILSADNTRKTLDEAEYVRRRAETVQSQLEAVGDRVRSQTAFVSSPPPLLLSRLLLY